MARQVRFYVGCSVELGLLVLAALLAVVLGLPLFADLHWSNRDVVAGGLASLPLFALFLWAYGSPAKPLAKIREFLELQARAYFAGWRLWQLATISAVAGLAEETLFRAVIQGGLARWCGPWVALVLASSLFGVLHRITRAYAVLAALVGAYLGLLWLWGGNLLIPIVAHALYDFAALVYLLRPIQEK